LDFNKSGVELNNWINFISNEKNKSKISDIILKQKNKDDEIKLIESIIEVDDINNN